MSTTPVRKPIEIKISTVVAVAAILNDTSMPALQEAMAQLTGGELILRLGRLFKYPE